MLQSDQRHYLSNSSHGVWLWWSTDHAKAIECKFEPFEWGSKHSNANSNHSNGIRTIHMQIRMQIWTIWMGFEAFKWDSKHSNGIWSIRMQIRNIWNGFKAFECKFEPFERDSKHSNANSNHSNANSKLLRDLKHSNANLNHSNGIRSIRMQIRTIRMGYEPFICKFKCKFEPFEWDSKHLKWIRSIRIQIRTIRTGFKAFKPFEQDSKHSNANLNHSKPN